LPSNNLLLFHLTQCMFLHYLGKADQAKYVLKQWSRTLAFGYRRYILSIHFNDSWASCSQSVYILYKLYWYDITTYWSAGSQAMLKVLFQLRSVERRSATEEWLYLQRKHTLHHITNSNTVFALKFPRNVSHCSMHASAFWFLTNSTFNIN